MKPLNLLAQWTLCLAAAVFLAPYTAVAADAPDAYAYVNFSRGFDCKLVKFIAAQPEWKQLVDVATKKIDVAYSDASQSPYFPKELVEMAFDKIRTGTGKRDISSKDVLEILRHEFEAVLVNVWFDPAVEKPEVVISIFTQFDPVELEDFLKLVPPMLYSRIKKDAFGTLYRFSGDSTVYVGFTHLTNRGDYVFAFSEQQSRVEQQLAFAKSGEFLKTVLHTSEPFDKLEITPAFFSKSREKILQEIKAKSGSDPNAQQVIAVLENLEGISLYTEDTSESTVTTLAVTMKKEEDAKNLKEAVEGLVAMFKMIASFSPDLDANAKKAIGLLSQVKFEQKAQTVSASLKYNTPEIESAIKAFLAIAVEELKK